jgi:hypothetical protein
MKPPAPPVAVPASARREAGVPRLNIRELLLIAVAGRVAEPRLDAAAQIGRDGMARLLPGAGGITLNLRVGDPCVGLAADRPGPGVALCKGPLSGPPDAENLALNAYACVGNRVLVLDGPGRGRRGVVTGKRGGSVPQLLLDFPGSVLARLRIGDRIQVYAQGLGLRLLDYPEVQVHNSAPRLLRAWGLQAADGRLRVPVTHLLPAGLIGASPGDGEVAIGAYDIQLADPEQRRRYGLGRLRLGDMVAISHADYRFGRAMHSGFISVGVIAYGDGVEAGRGPGVTMLLSGPAGRLEPLRDRRANLALMLRLRRPARARTRKTFIDKRPACAAAGHGSRARRHHLLTARTSV